MITRVTLFVIVLVSLATYASSPASAASAKSNINVACCDGDPNQPF